MATYKRKFNCAVCGEEVIYDSRTVTLACACEKARRAVPASELETNFLVVGDKEGSTISIEEAQLLAAEALRTIVTLVEWDTVKVSLGVALDVTDEVMQQAVDVLSTEKGKACLGGETKLEFNFLCPNCGKGYKGDIQNGYLLVCECRHRLLSIEREPAETTEE